MRCFKAIDSGLHVDIDLCMMGVFKEIDTVVSTSISICV